MSWGKAPEELVGFLEETLRDVNCQFRKMFGYPTYFINNNMFAGAHQEGLFLRLPPDDRESAMSEHDEIVPFEPMAGRVMKEYVVIPEHIYTDSEVFPDLLAKSVDYVSSLPPKEKRKKKR
jgi:TfoX/Sxy family transcriptional regulator of competence genes